MAEESGKPISQHWEVAGLESLVDSKKFVVDQLRTCFESEVVRLPFPRIMGAQS